MNRCAGTITPARSRFRISFPFGRVLFRRATWPTGEVWPLRTDREDGTAGRTVTGSAFRIIDGSDMVFFSLDETLRGAWSYRTTHTVGRSVALVRGIRRNVLSAGQLDFAANGLHAYVPAGAERRAPMAVRWPGADAVLLPMERGAFSASTSRATAVAWRRWWPRRRGTSCASMTCAVT